MNQGVSVRTLSDHDVTLTYALFNTILCWVCQRARANDEDLGQPIWRSFGEELAYDQPWGLMELRKTIISEGRTLTDLPSNLFLVGLRNAMAHGDHRVVTPLHIGQQGKANRRLIGFHFDVSFADHGQKRNELPRWGKWKIEINKIDMRRIAIACANKFCADMDTDNREDAKRHVLTA